jgi:predicted RNA-binding protein with PUA-like domain
MAEQQQQQHWLMKSEPEEFSIDDLARVRVEPWSGVRNYMARFHMRAMRVGDLVLFHHSSVEPPGVAGLARVVRTNVLDEKQFDPESPYHDPRATREAPIWDCVDVEYVATFPYLVSMDRMRAEPACASMLVLKRGMRLSVQPVTAQEYAAVVALGSTPPPPEAPAPAPQKQKQKQIKSRPRAAPRAKSPPRGKAAPPSRPKRASPGKSKSKPSAPSRRTALAKPAPRR